MTGLTDRIKKLAKWTHENSPGKSTLKQKEQVFKQLYYSATDQQKINMTTEWDKIGL